MPTNNSINLPNGTTGQLVVGVTGAAGAYASSASADFTFTSATAGATRTLTVSNTDNTNAASTALLAVTTGGASAGDAFHTVSTTTTTWAFGVDNSVTSPTADPFVISQSSTLGTNNIMSVATTGAINYPLQPTFSAYKSTTSSNVTGDNTAVTVIFDSELYDIGSNYNNGTGTFTAPVTGKYLFIIGVSVADTGAAGSNSNAVIVSLIATGASYIVVQQNFTAGNVTVCNFSGSIILSLTAADTVTIQATAFNGSKNADISGGSAPYPTKFSGQLIT